MIQHLPPLILLTLLLQGCTTPVKPWERGYLARSDMTFGSNVLAGRSRAQIHISKEASRGGSSAGGGGCGCN
ncbi:MAG: DUF4266 domain-containing protein [Gammaproteobacteria bacterium]|nr:DUF4266 domain-containing protein [Gammaproteobacteria bacterium]